jgi:hypothetical protein
MIERRTQQPLRKKLEGLFPNIDFSKGVCCEDDAWELSLQYSKKGDPQSTLKALSQTKKDLGLCLGILRDACKNARDKLWTGGNALESEIMNARVDALDYLIEEHRYDYRANLK